MEPQNWIYGFEVKQNVSYVFDKNADYNSTQLIIAKNQPEYRKSVSFRFFASE